MRHFFNVIIGSGLLAWVNIGIAAGTADGVLYWQQPVDLSIPVSGVVKQVLVSAGQSVKQGQTLLTLDERKFKAQLKAAQAKLAALAPERDEAKKELARAQELFDRTVLSQVELDEAMARFIQQDAWHRQASAAVEQARLAMEYRVLKAPFDLQIINTYVISGQTVVNQLQTAPVLRVARSRLVVYLNLDVSQLDRLSTGMAVTVDIANKTYPGQVSVMDYDVANTQMHVEILLDGDPNLRAGWRARVTWP